MWPLSVGSTIKNGQWSPQKFVNVGITSACGCPSLSGTIVVAGVRLMQYAGWLSSFNKMV
jgi:hypothetical protein